MRRLLLILIMALLPWQLAADAELALGQAEAFPKEYLESDYSRWLPAMFPSTFTAEFAPHHIRYWEWCWAIKRGVRPRPFIWILPRGGGKSSSVEATVAMFGARDIRTYGLFVCDTQRQADEHLASIEPKLNSDELRAYYPDLCERKLSEYGQVKGWRRNRLWTARGLVIDALGVDSASRGAKVEDQRPDFMIFDDVDKKDEGLAAVQTKIDTIGSSIIGTGSHDLAVIFIQNLIHRDSVASQMVDGRCDLLANAIIEGPHAALNGFTYKSELVEDPDTHRSRTKHFILTGEPVWKGQDISVCQGQLDDMGLEGFLREVQQEVKRAEKGALLSMFSELYSVITWTEFQGLYQRLATDRNGPCIPALGYIGNWQDVGGTPEHPNANVWVWRPAAGMAMADSVFVYRELVLPEYPEPKTLEISPVLVGGMVHKLEAPWNEGSRMFVRQISHEGKTEANAYLRDLPQVKDETTGQFWKPLRYGQWDAANPGHDVGVLQSYMTVIERNHLVTVTACDGQGAGVESAVVIEEKAATQCAAFQQLYPHATMQVEPCTHFGGRTICSARQHPFRPMVASKPLWGRPRLYLIVTDDQGRVEPNGEQRQPYDRHGLVRLRAEIPRFTEEKISQRTKKIFDDVLDGLLKAAKIFFVPIDKPRQEDQIEARLEPQYRKDAPPEVLAQLSPVAQQNFEMSAYYARAIAKANVETEAKKTKKGQGYYQRLRGFDRR